MVVRRWSLPFNRSHGMSLLLGGSAFLLAVGVILNPEAAFEASLKGLAIWWEVLLPAQLPFFILSELLMGLGLIHFLGVLFEPFMRPLFRVPGSGSFVLAVGLTSGNPLGAKLTARLREQGLITRTEGERLVAFSSTAGPLFMIGTVGVGFYHNPAVGMALALIHYVSNFIVGVLMRFHEPQAPASPKIEAGRGFILIKALRAMHRARLRDGRSLGQLLADAVLSSIRTSLMIGGFLVFFSVILGLLAVVRVTDQLTGSLGGIMRSIGWPAGPAEGLVNGLLEITLGAKTLADTASSIPPAYQLAFLNAIVAWAGLSIHAQVASLLSRTDIRYFPYCVARILHSVISFVLTLLLWDLLEGRLLAWLSMPAVARLTHANSWLQGWMFWSGTAMLGMSFFFLAGGFAWLVHRWRKSRPS